MVVRGPIAGGVSRVFFLPKRHAVRASVYCRREQVHLAHCYVVLRVRERLAFPSFRVNKRVTRVPLSRVRESFGNAEPLRV